MNNLHDKAFDSGLITINDKYKIELSNTLLKFENNGVKFFLISFKNKKIGLPDKFLPSKEFLKFHRENIFIE